MVCFPIPPQTTKRVPVQTPFAKLRPLPAYEHVYAGLPAAARANLAYFFDFDYQVETPRERGELRLDSIFVLRPAA